MINPHADSNSNKTCTKCGDSKPATIEYFYCRKDSGKYRNECKICLNKLTKERHKKRIAIPGAREQINKKEREARAKNPAYYNAISKRYRDRNPEKRSIVCIKWQKENPEKINAIQKRRYDKQKTDPNFRLNKNISSGIISSLKSGKDGRHWEELVDFTFEQLKNHLEKQFADGMTWSNYGLWHLEHKIPLSVHNFTSPEHVDFQKAWSLKNLQPMWAHDNLVKSNKLTKHFQPSLLL